MSGIKSKKEPEVFKRLKFKIPAGTHKGIIVRPKRSETSGEIDVVPVTQVGFYNRISSVYDYFTMEDVPSLDELAKQGYDVRKQANIHVYAEMKDDQESILERLRSKGMLVQRKNLDELPNFLGKHDATIVIGKSIIDDTLFRAISKIAFNYLAYVEGKDAVMWDDFDRIRNYILYGQGDADKVASVSNVPLLKEERTLGIMAYQGHMICVDMEGRLIIARVRLFNLATYRIVLCDNYHGIWRYLHHGHIFDTTSWSIRKVTPMK